MRHGLLIAMDDDLDDGMAPGRVAASKETCEAITEYLKRIGVQVDLQILEFGAWNAVKQAKEKDPSVAMIYATGPDPSKDVAYKLRVNTQSQLMTSWVFDKTNDDMLAKMNNFTDMKERDGYLNKILRHYHEQEDEFVFMIEGELVLIENDGEVVLKAGDCAGFQAGVGNAHRLVNRSGRDAVYIEVGTRSPHERVHYPDDDLHLVREGRTARWLHKSGEPYT